MTPRHQHLINDVITPAHVRFSHDIQTDLSRLDVLHSKRSKSLFAFILTCLDGLRDNSTTNLSNANQPTNKDPVITTTIRLLNINGQIL